MIEQPEKIGQGYCIQKSKGFVDIKFNGVTKRFYEPDDVTKTLTQTHELTTEYLWGVESK